MLPSYKMARVSASLISINIDGDQWSPCGPAAFVHVALPVRPLVPVYNSMSGTQ